MADDPISAAMERVRLLAERWAALEGDSLDVAIDRRVGGALLDTLNKDPRPAEVRLEHLRDLAEHWLTPGELTLFYPAAGQCVLDAINGTAPAANWYDDWEMTGRDGDGNAVLRHRPTGGLYRALPVEDTDG